MVYPSVDLLRIGVPLPVGNVVYLSPRLSLLDPLGPLGESPLETTH